MRTWIGIDFSGANGSWSPGTTKSNVWIAVVDQLRRTELRLSTLEQVQRFQTQDAAPPFKRLANFLRDGDFDCAAIDAPFSLPSTALPKGTRIEFLKRIERLPLEERRHIPSGSQLLDIAREALPALESRGTKSLYRVAERRFKATRTALWNGPRGGAAFTIACLRLLAEAKLYSLWDGATTGEKPRIVEGYPAGQLREWMLPAEKYNGADALAACNRKTIIAALENDFGLTIKTADRQTMLGNADALDAVICAFSAKAAHSETFVKPDGELPEGEGWIAIHPPTLALPHKGGGK